MKTNNLDREVREMMRTWARGEIFQRKPDLFSVEVVTLAMDYDVTYRSKSGPMDDWSQPKHFIETLNFKDLRQLIYQMRVLRGDQ